MVRRICCSVGCTMSLPIALAPLAAYRQFITYKLQPSTRPGKMDKIPCDWRTGNPANAHDPAIWTDYDTAYACSSGQVGFVFTDNDPFWFLDIDDCLLPTGWSPLALELCAALPGAAVEVSISGKGLHVFGTGYVPKHKTRGPAGTGLEFYHTGRFVALGLPETAQGNAATDCSAGLQLITERYFNRIEEAAATPMEWTDKPAADWRGPIDDDELIRRLRNSKSAAGVFGAKATAGQLWDADAGALGKAFPDSGGRPFDNSSADAALAQHLAFWTGKDCGRMKRLMLKSKLSRDKYDRDDYLPRTIAQAVAKQVDVCRDKPAELPSIAMAGAGGPQDVVGETYLNPEMQKLLFAGCCYVADINKIIMPGGHIYGHEQFDAILGGYSFVMDYATTKVSKSAWEAFTKSQAVRFDKAHTSSFRPDKTPGELWQSGNERQVNSYWPINIPTKKGNPAPFLKHLAKILPDRTDQAIMLSYMAAVVQHRGVKFQWCPLVQGTRGNGKTLLSRVVMEAIGRKHCHSPNSAEITDKFNDWQEGKIFIAVEDIYVPKERQEVLEALKPMITSDWQEIQGKGKDKVSRYICANYMLNSNHKDALKQTEDNRGLAVFYCAQQTVADLVRDGMDGNYFPDLYNWLKRDGYAIVADYLASYHIPVELDPALDCHRAPRTSSSDEAIFESLGNLEQEVMAAIDEERQGFRGGWVSSHFLDQLMRETGIRMARNKRRDVLKDLGYIVHPGLQNGQVNNPVQPDGCKPRLFIKADSELMRLHGGDVAKRYSDDQTTSNPFRVVQPLQSAAG